MPFGFLVPVLLAALGALAAPLLIHLRQRDRRRPRAFPSLMFLARVPIQTDRRKRITDWPLLLIRALALALLVAAFARPYLRRSVSPEGASAGLTVLVVDRSQSMADSAVQAALADSVAALLREIPGGGRIAVVGYALSAELLAAPTTDRALIGEALAAAKPSAAATRHVAGLRAAADLLGAEPVPGSLLLLTDMQAASIGAAGAPSLPPGTRFRVMTLVSGPRDNAAVRGLEVRPFGTPAGRRAAVAAEIFRAGGVAERSTTITLTVDGRFAASVERILPTEGTVRITFDTIALPRTTARLVVRLDEPDRLPADDVFHAVVTADEAVRVLLVAASPDAGRFVERALSIGRAPAVVVERVRSLDAAALARSAVVWFQDSPPPDGTLGEALNQFVEAGGGVVMAAGSLVSRPGGGAALDLLPAVVRGEAERDGTTLGEPALSHPALAAFRGSTLDPLATVRVRRHPRLEPRDGGRTLLRFDDGGAALVASSIGAGRTAVIAVPLELDGGDFPVQASFLPFVRGVAIWAGGLAAQPTALDGGDVWRLPASLVQPVVRSPSGDRPEVNDGLVVLPAEAGFHELFDGSAGTVPVAVVALNAPGGEADLGTMPSEELLLGVGTVDGTETGTVGGGQPPAAVELEHQQAGWRWLLLLAALLLGADVWIASRGWRGAASNQVVNTAGGGG